MNIFSQLDGAILAGTIKYNILFFYFFNFSLFASIFAFRGIFTFSFLKHLFLLCVLSSRCFILPTFLFSYLNSVFLYTLSLPNIDACCTDCSLFCFTIYIPHYLSSSWIFIFHMYWIYFTSVLPIFQ